jgi:2-methylcitrate dehydratase PrpD
LLNQSIVISVVARHAKFALAIQNLALSEAAVHHAKRSMIYWFAASLPDHLEAPATLIVQSLAKDAGCVTAAFLPSSIAVAMVPAHYDEWHITVMVGLNKKKIAHALSTVGTMAAGLQQAFRTDTMSKLLPARHAAKGGLLASMLTGTLRLKVLARISPSPR